MTQQDFALALGVSVAIVGGWERGTREPTDAQVEKMMRLLQVNRDDLGLSSDQTQ